jgi:hypothetical protein
MRRRSHLGLVFALACVLAPSAGNAQDAPPRGTEPDAAIGEGAGQEEADAMPEVPALVRAARRLLKQLDAVEEEFEDLGSQLKRASGDDQRVLDDYWDVTREVKCRFDQEGITIPIPQRMISVLNKS